MSRPANGEARRYLRTHLLRPIAFARAGVLAIGPDSCVVASRLDRLIEGIVGNRGALNCNAPIQLPDVSHQHPLD